MPTSHIVAYHKSIFSSSFDTEFFGKFDVVFNALDNLAARKHVNRMCISARIPLIESGTAGYLGQVEPLIPAVGINESQACNTETNKTAYRTGCYECQPRGLGQRHYPACTIRNTPSEPIHCVVWAKYLFNQLFGQPDVDDEDVSPDFTDPSLHHHLQADKLLSDENKNITNKSNGSDIVNTDSISSTIDSNSVKCRNQITLREWYRTLLSNEKYQSTPADSTAITSLIWRLFHHDIVTLVSMRDLWVDRQDRLEPSPLEKSTLEDALMEESNDESLHSTASELRDQRKLSTSGWLRIFMRSVKKLQNQMEDGGGDKYLVWDKDDQDAMDFVASASIIRSQLFHLPTANQLTRFTIKSLAGNIIPAVASTNAIVAGLMILQARNILSKQYERIRTVYLHRQPTGRRGNRRLVVPVEPAPPNPSCLVCSDSVRNSQLHLICAPELLTLRILRDRILIRHLGMLAPDVELPDRGTILISSEEGETDEVTHGTCLQCDDFHQDFTIRLILSCISVELANALSTASTTTSSSTLSSNNDSRLIEQFTTNEEQTETWRIVGDINAVLMNSQDGGHVGDNTLSTPSEEISLNGNVEHKDMSLNNEDLIVLNDEESTSGTGSSFKRKFIDTPFNNENVNGIASKKLRFNTVVNEKQSTESSEIVVPIASDKKPTQLHTSSSDFNIVLEKSKGFANQFTDTHLDELVNKILTIRQEYPNLIHDNNNSTELKQNLTIQSAHIKVQEIFEKIRHLLNKHYEDYDENRQISEVPVNESHSHSVDLLEKLKQSSDKIKQLNEALSTLLPVYTELKLNSSKLSNDQSNKENVEQCTASFEKIHKGARNLERLLLANEKLQNGLERLSQYTSSLPDLSDNPSISILSEILSSKTCCPASSSVNPPSIN
ncbi:SUMO-activating enzyme subunit 2 isoform 3 [Schistosoma japonicum]|uniref:SUMO-activating enzyme subunit 2 isoform 3 n=1 Tax=Schistosoma japonicum TaxID=6182 RepID=A0A4Z2CLW3_SCHJA|nr:SUMO-activating enzyme subunit 2 isoform 3 [Schistosoma japonicum]